MTPGLGRRLMAALLDEALVCAVVLGAAWAAGGVHPAHPWAAALLLADAAAVVLAGVLRGQTPGKRALGLGVRTLAGARAPVFAAFVRAAFRHGIAMLFWGIYITAREPAGFVLLLPGIYLLVDNGFAHGDKATRRSLHDIVAGTVVVSEKPSEQ